MVFFGEPSMADKIGFLITMVIVLSIFIYFEIKNWLENWWENRRKKMDKVKRTERGWAGHFCCAEMCRFRRNTLLEYDGKAVVVSTVGAMYNNSGVLEEIGLDRYYETMAFYADDSEYKDADVSREIYFNSPCSLKWSKDGYIDNEANAMHEKVVAELSEKLLKGEL